MKGERERGRQRKSQSPAEIDPMTIMGCFCSAEELPPAKDLFGGKYS